MKEILSSEILREDLFENCKYVVEELCRAGGAQMGIWVNPYGSTKKNLVRFILVYRSWLRNHFFFIDKNGKVMYVHNRWKNEYQLIQLKISDEEDLLGGSSA